MQDKDPLQEIWQDNYPRESPVLSEEELKRIVKQRANTPLDKILRNLKYEVIASIPLFPLLIWVTTFQPFLWMTIFTSAYVLIAVCSMTATLLFIKKEKKALQQTTDVLSGLIRMDNFLKKLRNASIWFIVLFSPPLSMVGFMSGVSLSYPDPAQFISKLIQMAEKAPWVFSLVVGFMLVIGISMFFLVRWVFGKMYGQHFKEISEMVVELESDD